MREFFSNDGSGIKLLLPSFDTIQNFALKSSSSILQINVIKSLISFAEDFMLLILLIAFKVRSLVEFSTA